MREKFIGYILLILGISVIFFSIFNVYFLFSKKIKPFEVFDLPAITLDLSGLMQSNIQESQLPPEANLNTELVKKEILNDPLNLIANIILYGFFVNSGFKIASLGILLLRPIKVDIKEDKSFLTK